MSTHTHHTMTYISKCPRVRFGSGLEFGLFFGRGGAGTTSGWGGVRYDVSICIYIYVYKYIYIIYIICVCIYYIYIYIHILCAWVSLGLNLWCKASGSTWVLSCCGLCAEATMPMRPFLHTGPSHIENKKDRHHKQQNHAGPTWHVEEDNSQGNCYVRFRQTCDPVFWLLHCLHRWTLGTLGRSQESWNAWPSQTWTQLFELSKIQDGSERVRNFWHMTQIKMSYDLHAKNENNRITLHHSLCLRVSEATDRAVLKRLCKLGAASKTAA